MVSPKTGFQPQNVDAYGPKRDLHAGGNRGLEQTEQGPEPVRAEQRKLGGLALGELEPFAGALLSILLALTRTRIAGEVAQALQLGTQLGIEFHKRA